MTRRKDDWGHIGPRPRVRSRRRPQPAAGSRIRALRPPQPAHDRRAALTRVLALWPQELADDSPEARGRLLAKLESALRAERRRGLAGHWTYDLARHAELLRLYREELAAAGTRRPTWITGKGPS